MEEKPEKIRSDLEDVEEAVSRLEEQLGATRRIAIDIVEIGLGMEWTPHEAPPEDVAKRRLVRISERISHLKSDAGNLADNLGFLRNAVQNNSPVPETAREK